MVKSTGPAAPDTPRGKRSNGEGSLYLNDGRWRGAIIWTDPDGVQHRKTFAAKLQSTVKDRMADFRRDLERAPAGCPRRVPHRCPPAGGRARPHRGRAPDPSLAHPRSGTRARTDTHAGGPLEVRGHAGRDLKRRFRDIIEPEIG